MSPPFCDFFCFFSHINSGMTKHSSKPPRHVGGLLILLSIVMILCSLCVTQITSMHFTMMNATTTSFKMLFTIDLDDAPLYTFPHGFVRDDVGVDSYSGAWFLEFGSPHFTAMSPSSGDCTFLPAQYDETTQQYQQLLTQAESTLISRLYTPGHTPNNLKRLYFTPSVELNHVALNKVVGLEFKLRQANAKEIFPNIADRITAEYIHHWVFECTNINTTLTNPTTLAEGLFVTPHHIPWDGVSVLHVDTGDLSPQRLDLTTSKTTPVGGAGGDALVEIYQPGFVPHRFVYNIPPLNDALGYTAEQKKILQNHQLIFEGGTITIDLNRTVVGESQVAFYDHYLPSQPSQQQRDVPQLRCVKDAEDFLIIANFTTDLRATTTNQLMGGPVIFQSSTGAELSAADVAAFSEQCIMMIHFPLVTLANNTILHPFSRIVDFYSPGHSYAVPFVFGGTRLEYIYKRNYTYRQAKLMFIKSPDLTTTTIDEMVEQYYCGENGYVVGRHGYCQDACAEPFLPNSPLCGLKRCGDFSIDYLMKLIDSRAGGIPYMGVLVAVSPLVNDATHHMLFTPDGRPIISLKTDPATLFYRPPPHTSTTPPAGCVSYRGMLMYGGVEERMTKTSYSLNFHDPLISSKYYPLMIYLTGSPEMVFGNITNWVEQTQLLWVDGRVKKLLQFQPQNLEYWIHPNEEPVTRVEVAHPIHVAVFVYSQTVRCLCRFATTANPLLRLVWRGQQLGVWSPSNCSPSNTAFAEQDGDCAAYRPPAKQQKDEQHGLVMTFDEQNGGDDVVIDWTGQEVSPDVLSKTLFGAANIAQQQHDEQQQQQQSTTFSLTATTSRPLCDAQWGLVYSTTTNTCTCPRGATMVTNTAGTQQRCIHDTTCKCAQANIDPTLAATMPFHGGMCRYYKFSDPTALADFVDIYDWNILSYQCQCAATGMIDLPNPSNTTETTAMTKFIGVYCDVPARCSHAASCDGSLFLQPKVVKGKCVKAQCECIKKSNFVPINPAEDITLQGCQCAKLKTSSSLGCDPVGTHPLSYSPLRCDMHPQSAAFPPAQLVVENAVSFQPTTQPATCYCLDNYGGDRCQYPASFVSFILTYPDEDLHTGVDIASNIQNLFTLDSAGRKQARENVVAYLTMMRTELNVVDTNTGLYASLFSHEQVPGREETKVVFKVWSASALPTSFNLLQQHHQQTTHIPHITLSAPLRRAFKNAPNNNDDAFQMQQQQTLQELWEQYLSSQEQIGVNSGVVVGLGNDFHNPTCTAGSTSPACTQNGAPPSNAEAPHNTAVNDQDKANQDSTRGLFNFNPDFNEPKDGPSTTALIVGLVVGLVGIFLFFLVVILLVMYCKKHEKACFEKKKKGKKNAASGTLSASGGSTTTDASSAAGSKTTKSVEMPQSQQLSQNIMLSQGEEMPHDPTLPEGWKPQKDHNSGKIYYLNTTTLESSWNHPAQSKDGNDNGW